MIYDFILNIFDYLSLPVVKEVDHHFIILNKTLICEEIIYAHVNCFLDLEYFKTCSLIICITTTTFNFKYMF